MIIRDQILVGDGSIGNYVVGFFNCGDHDDDEMGILRAYRALGYWNVKPIFKAGCLDAVQHEGLNERMPVPAGYQKAVERIRETCGDNLFNQIEMIKKYRTETQTA